MKTLRRYVIREIVLATAVVMIALLLLFAWEGMTLLSAGLVETDGLVIDAKSGGTLACGEVGAVATVRRCLRGARLRSCR